MTTTSSTGSAASSIITSLGSGSGIDLAALTTSLVEAQFAAKTAQIKSRSDTLTSQISGAATLKSGITGFATALTSLVKGGTLQTQPTSSSGVITVSAMAGAKLSGLSASVSVNRLATAQAASTAPLGARSAMVGTGTLSIQLGTATVDDTGAMSGFAASGTAAVVIEIGDGDATLDGIAKKINAAGAGVTATVVTDLDGQARLSLKGKTGAAQGFTVSAAEGATPGLSRLAVGPGAATTITATAGNAKLTVDGIAVERASNTVTDLIDGVKMELGGVTAAPATIGSTTPTAGILQAVNDVVTTYNEFLAQVKEQTDPMTGSLRGDSAAQALLRNLRQLTLTPLIPGDGTTKPTTLASIGVGTNRDGTLSVNSTTLADALAKNPDALEAMFAPGTGATRAGLSAALNTVSFNATSSLTGLGASTTRYTQRQGDLADLQAKVEDQSEAMKNRLVKQFSSMDARVAAYKSTQTFLENQIKAWNADN